MRKRQLIRDCDFWQNGRFSKMLVPLREKIYISDWLKNYCQNLYSFNYYLTNKIYIGRSCENFDLIGLFRRKFSNWFWKHRFEKIEFKVLGSDYSKRIHRNVLKSLKLWRDYFKFSEYILKYIYIRYICKIVGFLQISTW